VVIFLSLTFLGLGYYYATKMSPRNKLLKRAAIKGIRTIAIALSRTSSNFAQLCRAIGLSIQFWSLRPVSPSFYNTTKNAITDKYQSHTNLNSRVIKAARPLCPGSAMLQIQGRHASEPRCTRLHMTWTASNIQGEVQNKS
jgi:hypothetical protein